MTKRAIAVIAAVGISLAACTTAEATPPTKVATVEQVQPQAAPFLLEERTIEYRRTEMPDEFQAAVSRQAKDLKGYERSLYRGKYYYKSQERFRKCVMKRESNYRYKAANRVSSARGAYQFLDNSWRDGLVHMMVKESKKTGDYLKPRAKKLRKKPIHRWNRYWQDRAFFTALNWNGKWSGKAHWNATVKGTGC
jgi:hypothetical protein